MTAGDVDARIFRRLVNEARSRPEIAPHEVDALAEGRCPMTMLTDDEAAALIRSQDRIVESPTFVTGVVSEPEHRYWVMLFRPLDGSPFLLVDAAVIGIYMQGDAFVYAPDESQEDSDIWPAPIVLPNSPI